MATSILTIEELSGQKRRLTLRGAGLPIRGVAFGSTTVVSTTWNNGNPEATQQVLSPQELPTEMSGEWRTNMLLSSGCEYEGPEGRRQVGLAFELKEIVDGLRLSGQLLSVVWTNEQVRKAQTGVASAVHTHQEKRLGRLVEFNPRFSDLDVIQWSATFDWVSRGSQSPKTIDFRGEELVAAVRSAINSLEALTRAVSLAQLRSMQAQGFRQKHFTNTFTLGQLEQVAESALATVDSFARVAQSASDRLRKIGDLVLATRDLPFAIANRVLDVAQGGVGAVTSFVDQVSQKSPEQQILGSKVSTLTRTAAYFDGVQTQAQLVEAANNRLSQQARLRRSALGSGSQPLVSSAKSGDVLQTHIPRDGETMTSIAFRYYEADLSRELSLVNGLPGETIVPPRRTTLIIPTRSVLEQRSLRSV